MFALKYCPKNTHRKKRIFPIESDQIVFVTCASQATLSGGSGITSCWSCQQIPDTSRHQLQITASPSWDKGEHGNFHGPWNFPWGMEISMGHGNFQVLEISMAHGNFHPPWKIPWPMEISMLGLMSGWTRGDARWMMMIIMLMIRWYAWAGLPLRVRGRSWLQSTSPWWKWNKFLLSRQCLEITCVWEPGGELLTRHQALEAHSSYNTSLSWF